VGAERASRRAEEEKIRKREQARRDRERKRWRDSLTGEALLNQLQVEAYQEARCPEVTTEDPPKVCGKPSVDATCGAYECGRHLRRWLAQERAEHGRVPSGFEVFERQLARKRPRSAVGG
jgi:hypothetical protein